MTTTGIAILDLIADIQSSLSRVAPSYDDAKSLERNDDPKRYVWVLDEVTPATFRNSGGVGRPKTLLTETWEVIVHCWGDSRAESLRLRQALLTVLRNEVGPVRYTGGRSTFKGGEEHTQKGFVCLVELAISLETNAADLAAIGNTGEVKDAVTKEARVTAVEFESGGTEADGILDALES